MGRLIQSRDNTAFKALRALATDPREIRRQGRTLIDGPHLLETYRRRIGLPRDIVVSETGSTKREIMSLVTDCPGVEPLILADALFRELSGVATPVGVLALIDVPDAPSGEMAGSCVLLDAIQDSGNVGAILRTAAAAGIVDVALGPGCAGAWTPRVLRAAQGAHFSLRIREAAPLDALIASFPGISLATMAGAGDSLFDLDLTGDIAWILGNEGAGVREELATRATRRVTIPLVAAESLNVAAAAAVCLFEARRQRHSNREINNG